MTKEKLRDVEGYIQYMISQTTPEEQIYEEKKLQLRVDLATYYGDLMQHLDEKGRAILNEYVNCDTELMKLEKAASFIEGRTASVLALSLKKKLKKCSRK